MTPTRWLLTILSFAAAIGASGWVVWSSWPAGGATVALPLGAQVLAGLCFVTELLSRAWKIQFSAHALHVRLSFGAALRVCLGGDFGAAITPARSGAEPARYLVLTEARVPPAGRLLVLFAELVLEMLSLAIVVAVLAVLFRGSGGALVGVESLVGGYAAFVLVAGGAGVLLSRRNANGPPPRWARAVGLNAGRWRVVQRSLRQLRASTDAVRRARVGMMALALFMSVVHIAARVLILPALVAGAGVLSGSRAHIAPLLLWPLALQYGGIVSPAPGGGGFIEAAYGAALRGSIPAQIFGASLIWWRFWTFYLYVLLGALAAGRTVLRALRRDARGNRAEPLDEPAADVAGRDALPAERAPAAAR